MKTAVLTGASSGIGAAAARALAGDGWRLVLGARRLDRLEQVAAEVGAEARRLDVSEPDSVAEFCAAVPECHLLVNNAGGALGLDPVADTDEERWRAMFESNAMGTMRMTKALLPQLRASGDGHMIGVTSIAAFESYRGGAGYSAAKHAQRAVMRTLRLELLGEPIRISEIVPGMTETEFSLVRLGDEDAAAAVYRGVEPLRAPEVAECIRWVAAQPSHVNVDELLVRPRDQARSNEVHRRED
ncbi:MAG TPA: SDR family NAD(P)-dependent oxidoreductase [Solirubrobacterales bacterium]|jgi:NADP-dependent 3-hydroxy acid dehydrogenase YdfG